MVVRSSSNQMTPTLVTVWRELEGVNDLGIPYKDIYIEDGDVCIPICHEGMNRSQVLYTLLLLLSCPSYPPYLYVYTSHGALSGWDLDTQPLNESNYYLYAVPSTCHCVGLFIVIWMNCLRPSSTSSIDTSLVIVSWVCLWKRVDPNSSPGLGEGRRNIEYILYDRA